MVRAVDGFFGGLFAGVTSAAFSVMMAAGWEHDAPFVEFFSLVGTGLPPFHGAGPSWQLAGLGFVLYLLVSVACGMAYAAIARGMPSMWRAPTSVVWGASYGLLVWWAINDVLVPLIGAVDYQPLWQGLVGTIVFYGIVLSEVTTLAQRRRARFAP